MRVLILMSDTGGGHRSCTIALQQEFAHWFPGKHQVFHADIYRGCAPWPFRHIPDVYPIIAHRWPWLWQGIFETYGGVVDEERVAACITAYCEPFIVQLLSAYAPDLIIVVNPLLHAVLFRVLHRRGWTIPVAVVVSDLITPHKSWFHAQLALCFVPTAQVAVLAQRTGVDPARIRVYGLPVRREFISASLDKACWKRTLGFAEDKPLVLLVGGGEGMGNIPGLLARMMHAVGADYLPPLQVAVICGHNEKLRQYLQAQYAHPHVRIVGYTTDIHAWMAASDCAVTKAGPNTIMEAAALGLPVLLSSYIPGQEAQNPAFVMRHGMGRYASDIPGQVSILRDWLRDRDMLQHLAAGARTASTPYAGHSIVRELDHHFA